MSILEITIAILATTTAIATAITAVSEALPFFKRISGNGVIHTLWHLGDRRRCETPVSPVSPEILPGKPTS